LKKNKYIHTREIVIDLSENYLIDNDLIATINFINTSKLKLVSNQITEASFSIIKQLLKSNKYLIINLSNNSISLRNLCIL
jgi:hypothetical protein